MKQKYLKKNGQPIESYQNTNIFAAAKSILMQADKHPSEYRYVVFQDMTNGHKFLTRSCVTTTETVTWEEDGKDYPIYKLEISNKSHPFFTGKKMLVDTAGRIEKFNRKFRKAKK